MRAVHLTHTACADRGKDSIRAELRANQDGLGDVRLGFQKTFGLRAPSQQGFNVVPQVRIGTTLAIQIGLA
jgi:hypothetical protein